MPKNQHETSLQLIPQPQKLSINGGWFILPVTGSIGIDAHNLYPLARYLKTQLVFNYRILVEVPGLLNTLSINCSAGLKPQEYQLNITNQGIHITGGSYQACFHAIQTLRQIAEQTQKKRLPILAIHDWPDLQERGLLICIAHGRIPKIKHLKQVVEGLAYFKINHLQLYHKDTFEFQKHPEIGKDNTRMTAEEILELDEFCKQHCIELVPALASFGHMEDILKHPQYHHLAEDWGIGKYLVDDLCKREKLKIWRDARKAKLADSKAYSLAPANPEIYHFLDSLYSEFLPLFHSDRVNLGCDETIDLGCGQSYEISRKIGCGRLYLNHILKLRELCARYGKKIMIWGDIVRKYPNLIAEIPSDVSLLDWNYSPYHNFDSIQELTKAGLNVFCCPSTSSYQTLFPHLPKSKANIAGFAEAAFRHGAAGLLNTEWGDAGYHNFTDTSWYGFVLAAEQSWNTKAETQNFSAKFSRLFFKSKDPSLPASIDRLGQISYLNKTPVEADVWHRLYFAAKNKPFFSMEGFLDFEMYRKIRGELLDIRSVFVANKKGKKDPYQVLPYWIFAVDTLVHALNKLDSFAYPNGKTPIKHDILKKEFAQLKKRFRALWLKKNHLSKIKVILDAYDRAAEAIATFKKPEAYTDFVTTFLISKPFSNVGKLEKLLYRSKQEELGFKERNFHGVFCNLQNREFNCKPDDVMVFIKCYLTVSEPMQLEICMGYDGPVRLWVDGQNLFFDPAGAIPGFHDKARIPYDAAIGKHEILIAFSSDFGNAWGLFLRFFRKKIPVAKIYDTIKFHMPTVSVQ